jgi:hypothetical protein
MVTLSGFELDAELVRLSVDAIVSFGTPPTVDAMAATKLLAQADDVMNKPRVKRADARRAAAPSGRGHRLLPQKDKVMFSGL